MWYTYTMEYYSATEKNEMMPLAATRTGLEMTASDGERRTSQAAAYRWNPHTEKSELGTSLVLQSLRILASTAGCMGSITGQGSKIPHALRHGQNDLTYKAETGSQT